MRHQILTNNKYADIMGLQLNLNYGLGDFVSIELLDGNEKQGLVKEIAVIGTDNEGFARVRVTITDKMNNLWACEDLEEAVKPKVRLVHDIDDLSISFTRYKDRDFPLRSLEVFGFVVYVSTTELQDLIAKDLNESESPGKQTIKLNKVISFFVDEFEFRSLDDDELGYYIESNFK